MTKANSDNNAPAGSAPRIADDFDAIRNSPLSRVADVVAPAIASMPDPLIALCDKWREAFAENLLAHGRFNNAERATLDAKGAGPAALRALERAEQDADEAKNVANDRAHAILDEIVETAPVTIEGLFAKLRLMADEVRGGYPPGGGPEHHDIYERTFLQLAAASAALAAPAALAAALPTTAPVDPLIALAKAERTAYRAWASANTALDRAEGALMKTKSLPQLRGIMAGKYYCYSPEAVLSHCQPLDPEGPDAATGARLAEAIRTAIEDYRVERIEAGLGDLVAAEDAAGEVWEASRQKMADTPAQTFAGIAAKLRFVKEDMEIGDSEVTQEVLVSALADAERLAG